MKAPAYITPLTLSTFITSALQEDIGGGDYSSVATVPAHLQGRAKLIIKQDGVIAGITLAQKILTHYDKTLVCLSQKKDGEWARKGDIALYIEGNVRSMLAVERTVLNCMQRMSGIATYTHNLCHIIRETSAQLLDTRKTTPNFRLMEKWAVVIGGGCNHRIGLDDMIMLKDNHIDVAGGVKAAIVSTLEYLKYTKKKMPIEVETRNIEEVKEALSVGNIDIIMLDNMCLADIKQAVSIIEKTVKVEASGSITAKNIYDVAMCGVDYISVGALTHAATSLDMSLKVSA